MVLPAVCRPLGRPLCPCSSPCPMACTSPLTWTWRWRWTCCGGPWTVTDPLCPPLAGHPSSWAATCPPPSPPAPTTACPPWVRTWWCRTVGSTVEEGQGARDRHLGHPTPPPPSPVARPRLWWTGPRPPSPRMTSGTSSPWGGRRTTSTGTKCSWSRASARSWATSERPRRPHRRRPSAPMPMRTRGRRPGAPWPLLALWTAVTAMAGVWLGTRVVVPWRVGVVVVVVVVVWLRRWAAAPAADVTTGSCTLKAGGCVGCTRRSLCRPQAVAGVAVAVECPPPCPPAPPLPSRRSPFVECACWASTPPGVAWRVWPLCCLRAPWSGVAAAVAAVVEGLAVGRWWW
jgi:hypothetical protein